MILSKPRLFLDLGYQPHPIQAEVHSSTAHRRVLACGVRFGKTKCAAMEAVAASLEPTDMPARGWVVAPDYGLAEKVYREIVFTFLSRLPHHVVSVKEHEPGGKLILVRNMGGELTEIRAKTAENPTSLLGEGLDWLVVDEAARLKPDVWERYLAARLIDKRGWALLISTPRGKGWFYDAWRRKADGWRSWNASTETNPYISKDELERLRLLTPDLVWRQEYEAQFIEGAGQVFRNVRDLAVGEPEERRAGRRYCAGLDLARVEDFTVLIVMDDQRRVVSIDRFTRVDWSIQGRRIKAGLERYGSPPCLVDSTGAGEPVYEQLLAIGVNAIPYPFTNASKKALIDNLALMLERRELTLLKDEQLVEEMESFEYSVTEHGTVRTGAPAGYHDDCVIALALAAWEGRDVGEFEVQWV